MAVAIDFKYTCTWQDKRAHVLYYMLVFQVFTYSFFMFYTYIRTHTHIYIYIDIYYSLWSFNECRGIPGNLRKSVSRSPRFEGKSLQFSVFVCTPTRGISVRVHLHRNGMKWGFTETLEVSWSFLPSFPCIRNQEKKTCWRIEKMWLVMAVCVYLPIEKVSVSSKKSSWWIQIYFIFTRT